MCCAPADGRAPSRPASLELLDSVIAGGSFCYPALERDPWLDPLRRKPAFGKLLKRAGEQHRGAVEAFETLNGASVLPMVS
jgi:hypothetical protein